MYPKLTTELEKWLSTAEGPVVFVSLGTVTLLSQEELESVYDQFQRQNKYFFIWAVKTQMLQTLHIDKSRKKDSDLPRLIARITPCKNLYLFNFSCY